MAYEILMPQLSDSMTEGKLISWKVKPQDHVKAGDTIAEVESDKAIMEVQSFQDGIVKELKIKEGQSAPVGSVIAVIDTDSAKEAAKMESSALSEETDKKVSKEASSEQFGSKQAAYEQKKRDKVTNKQSSQPSTSIVDEIFKSKAKTFESKTQNAAQFATKSVAASPRARILATRYGIKIEKLQQKGELPTPVHAEDIERYYRKKFFTPKAWRVIEEYQLDPTLFANDKKHTETEILSYINELGIPKLKPIGSKQKALIANVKRAAQKPIYHIFDRIEASLLLQHESKEITITVWLLKLLAEMMMRNEVLRSRLTPEGIRIYPNASISLAVAHAEDLYMPVFKDLNRKSVHEIAQELKAMKSRIKDGKLSLEDMRDSTFGLSNLGMTGIERFDAMINSQDSGIAAVGSIIEGKISISFTLDHRLVNGYQGALAMQTLKSLARDEMFFKE